MKSLFATAAILLTSTFGIAGLQALRFEAGTPRYEMTSTVVVTMDGTVESTAKTFVKVGLNITADKGDTLNVIVDVDSTSMTSDSTTRLILPRGARTVMRVLSNGKVAVAATEDDVLGTLMSELFVVLPSSSAPGSTAVDTLVERDSEMEEMGIEAVKMIVTTKVLGDTTYDGVAAFKIEQVGKLIPIRKDSTMTMGAIKMSVNGDVNGVAYLSKTGTLLALDSRGSVNLKMDITMMGQSQSLDMKQALATNARKVR